MKRRNSKIVFVDILFKFCIFFEETSSIILKIKKFYIKKYFFKSLFLNNKKSIVICQK